MRQSLWKESSILCLDDQQATLYVELIQQLPKQSLAWLRPFALRVDESHVPEQFLECGDRLPDGDAIIFDVRNTADLIWPIHFFRMGLDTEVLQIMSVLPDLNLAEPCMTQQNRDASRHILNHFLRVVWQSTREHFPNTQKKSSTPWPEAKPKPG
jgi:hypothetical protein